MTTTVRTDYTYRIDARRHSRAYRFDQLVEAIAWSAIAAFGWLVWHYVEFVFVVFGS